MLYGTRPSRCLAVSYGQRHAKELGFARFHADKLRIPLEVVEVPPLFGSQLTDGGGSVVVPFRNAIMLGLAVNRAEAGGLERVTIATNRDDWEMFPDCTPNFLAAYNRMLSASGIEVVVKAPYVYLTKKQIVELGRSMSIDLEATWSCYAGGDSPCGSCLACRLRAEALA